MKCYFKSSIVISTINRLHPLFYVSKREKIYYNRLIVLIGKKEGLSDVDPKDYMKLAAQRWKAKKEESK